MITFALPRYIVEARIKSLRLPPISVFESSRAPATTSPDPCCPGSVSTASPELTPSAYKFSPFCSNPLG